MPLFKKYKIKWEDIDLIYDDLNKQQSRFGFTQTTPDSYYKKKIKINELDNLINNVEAMNSNPYIKASAILTNLPETQAKDKIKAFDLSLIQDKINQLSSVCTCDDYNPCPNNYTSNYYTCSCDDDTCGCDDDECNSDCHTCNSDCYTCNNDCYDCTSFRCNNEDTDCQNEYGGGCTGENPCYDYGINYEQTACTTADGD